MKGKPQIRFLSKIIFIIIQLLLFLFSISLIIILGSIYYKLKRYISIGYRPVLMSIMHTSTLNLASILGIISYNESENGAHFIYIVLCLVMMNMQIMMMAKSHELVIKTPVYFASRFSNLSAGGQKIVEDILDCSDRENDKIKCRTAMIRLAEGIREKFEVLILTLFFLESLSIALMLFLKNKRKKNF